MQEEVKTSGHSSFSRYLQARHRVVVTALDFRRGPRAFQASQRRRRPQVAFTTWRRVHGACLAAARAREKQVARAAVGRWRRVVQRSRADGHLARARALRALQTWRVAFRLRLATYRWLRPLALAWLGQSRQQRRREEVARVYRQARDRGHILASRKVWRRLFRLSVASRALYVRRLNARIFIAWVQISVRKSAQQDAEAQFLSTGQRRLLRSHWARWRLELLRVSRGQLEEEEEEKGSTCLQQRPVGGCALHRWRAAIRSRRAWHSGSSTLEKQACSYGTRAAGLSPASLGGPVGKRKLRKMPLRWRSRKGVNLSSRSPRQPLLCSSVGRWLPADRNQAGVLQLPSQPGHEKPATGQQWDDHAGAPQTQRSGDHLGAAAQDGIRLGRKYLQRWRHAVLLQKFLGLRRVKQLAGAWQCWKVASEAEQLAQALFGQRQLEWAWGTWRRRLVQLRVARHFQQQEDGRLLSQVFGGWYQRTAARLRDGGKARGDRFPAPAQLEGAGPAQAWRT
ncbi:uncharacterized protein LOC103166613 isoform X1 [Ornithorhynchus anatinus]|uniref:uncharacterized protein LOC103166613 isoform X1 n=1 Tax=Ornithorhynchus anatinus TaxID=9258 RepID=UPI0019D4E931|nr:uncharacterized protein LOC103166613 isoform X1 [Ornithorhynchus anatinus]